MSDPWRVRAERLKNGGGTVWSIYRLACAARHLASVLNELDKLMKEVTGCTY